MSLWVDYTRVGPVPLEGGISGKFFLPYSDPVIPVRLPITASFPHLSHRSWAGTRAGHPSTPWKVFPKISPGQTWRRRRALVFSVMQLKGCFQGLLVVVPTTRGQREFGRRINPTQSRMGSPNGSVVKNPPAKQEIRVRSLGQEDSLEEGVATHSSILAWEIPGTEEPGGYSPRGRKEVRHNLVTKQHQQRDGREVRWGGEREWKRKREQTSFGCTGTPQLCKAINSLFS